MLDNKHVDKVWRNLTVLAVNCVFLVSVFFFQCHHMFFVNFVVLPPGHGRSVTDF
jgi:hypothetical protein